MRPNCGQVIGSIFIDDREVEAVTGSLGTFVTMLYRRDIEIDAGEIVD
jgi:hypothetical protein